MVAAYFGEPVPVYELRVGVVGTRWADRLADWLMRSTADRRGRQEAVRTHARRTLEIYQSAEYPAGQQRMSRLLDGARSAEG